MPREDFCFDWEYSMHASVDKWRPKQYVNSEIFDSRNAATQA